MARTRAPAGSSAASKADAACALVTTSVASASMPSSHRCRATTSGGRAALFVTKASRVPPRRASASASGAPGTAFGPTYTTPSRSSSRTSCSLASGRGHVPQPPPGASGTRALLGLATSAQGGARLAQPLRVLGTVGTHGGRHRKMLRALLEAVDPCEAEAEGEVPVVRPGRQVHEPAEGLHRPTEVPGVVPGPAQGLPGRRRRSLGLCSMLQQHRSSARVTSLQKLGAALPPLVRPALRDAARVVTIAPVGQAGVARARHRPTVRPTSSASRPGHAEPPQLSHLHLIAAGRAARRAPEPSTQAAGEVDEAAVSQPQHPPPQHGRPDRAVQGVDAATRARDHHPRHHHDVTARQLTLLRPDPPTAQMDLVHRRVVGNLVRLLRRHARLRRPSLDRGRQWSATSNRSTDRLLKGGAVAAGTEYAAVRLWTV